MNEKSGCWNYRDAVNGGFLFPFSDGGCWPSREGCERPRTGPISRYSIFRAERVRKTTMSEVGFGRCAKRQQKEHSLS